MVLAVDCVEMLQAISMRSLDVGDSALNAKTVDHHEAYQNAYGTDGWAWKNHAAYHLADMYKRHGKLPVCFTMERRHHVIRTYTIHRTAQKGYEKGLIEEVTCDHLNSLDDDTHDPFMSEGLLPPVSTAPRKLQRALRDLVDYEPEEVRTAARMRVGNCTVSKGDVVAVKDASAIVGWTASTSRRGFGCAEVWFNVCCDGVRLTCVAPWAVKAEGEKWAKLSMSDEPLLLRSSELLSPLIFMKSSSSCLVLIPLHLR